MDPQTLAAFCGLVLLTAILIYLWLRNPDGQPLPPTTNYLLAFIPAWALWGVFVLISFDHLNHLISLPLSAPQLASEIHRINTRIDQLHSAVATQDQLKNLDANIKTLSTDIAKIKNPPASPPTLAVHATPMPWILLALLALFVFAVINFVSEKLFPNSRLANVPSKLVATSVLTLFIATGESRYHIFEKLIGVDLTLFKFEIGDERNEAAPANDIYLAVTLQSPQNPPPMRTILAKCDSPIRVGNFIEGEPAATHPKNQPFENKDALNNAIGALRNALADSAQKKDHVVGLAFVGSTDHLPAAPKDTNEALALRRVAYVENAISAATLPAPPWGLNATWANLRLANHDGTDTLRTVSICVIREVLR